VERIKRTALDLGASLDTAVFATRDSWQHYAANSLMMVSKIADDLGLADRLHLWPDKSLGARAYVLRMKNPGKYLEWLNHCWSRVSEWPHGERHASQLLSGQSETGGELRPPFERHL
jgi:hypothetical protein